MNSLKWHFQADESPVRTLRSNAVWASFWHESTVRSAPLRPVTGDGFSTCSCWCHATKTGCIRKVRVDACSIQGHRGVGGRFRAVAIGHGGPLMDVDSVKRPAEAVDRGVGSVSSRSANVKGVAVRSARAQTAEALPEYPIVFTLTIGRARRLRRSHAA